MRKIFLVFILIVGVVLGCMGAYINLNDIINKN